MKERWANSMECYCYLQNVSDLLCDGKTPMKNGSENHFLMLGAMVEYHFISAKDISRLHQFGPKV